MKYLGALLVAAFLLPPAHAQVSPKGEPSEAKDGAATAQEPAPARKRRLKFKSDKACTCASALGEADIEVAEQKAAAQSQPRRNEK